MPLCYYETGILLDVVDCDIRGRLISTLSFDRSLKYQEALRKMYNTKSFIRI